MDTVGFAGLGEIYGVRIVTTLEMYGNRSTGSDGEKGKPRVVRLDNSEN